MRSAGLLLVTACGRFGFSEVPRSDASADTGGPTDVAVDASVAACTAVSANDWLASAVPLDSAKNYSTSADGTIAFDSVTGLAWERMPTASAYDVPGAMAYCASLTLGGCTHWRLPQRIELATLVDHRFTMPVVDASMFPGTQTDQPYWTMTPSATSANNNWVINFYNGNTFWDATTQPYHVRCVSAGAVGMVPPARYEIATSTVRDRATGLTWVRTPDVTAYSQSGAAAHCANLGAYRLPEIQELETLIDSSRSSPAIDPTAFPSAPSATFWSSSSYGVGAGMILDFSSGGIINAVPTDPYVVRCVM